MKEIANTRPNQLLKTELGHHTIAWRQNWDCLSLYFMDVETLGHSLRPRTLLISSNICPKKVKKLRKFWDRFIGPFGFNNLWSSQTIYDLGKLARFFTLVDNCHNVICIDYSKFNTKLLVLFSFSWQFKGVLLDSAMHVSDIFINGIWEMNKKRPFFEWRLIVVVVGSNTTHF